MNYIKIRTGRYPDESTERIPYVEKEDGWYVNTKKVDGNDEFRLYAHQDAREMDLRQLLRKEYDARY